MGLLDDAIRQHLELKRQHGAAEEELQRQEEEALGPARRDVAAADATGDEVELEAPEAEEEAPVADAGPEAHEEETVLQEPEVAFDEPESILDEPESILDQPEGLLDEPESEVAAEPEPAPEPSAQAPYDAAADVPGFQGDEVVEEEEALEPPVAEDEEQGLFDEGDEDEPEEGDPEAPGDADVLEDTPDFLQETPEHDRLWFEQKPPRDFDFD